MSSNGREEDFVPDLSELTKPVRLSDHARTEILRWLKEAEPQELRKLTELATDDLLKPRGLLGWLGLSTSTG